MEYLAIRAGASITPLTSQAQPNPTTFAVIGGQNASGKATNDVVMLDNLK